MSFKTVCGELIYLITRSLCLLTAFIHFPSSPPFRPRPLAISCLFSLSPQYNIVTVVTILYFEFEHWREETLVSHHKKKKVCTYVWWWMLTKLTVEIVFQYRHIADYNVVYIKQIQCYMSLYVNKNVVSEKVKPKQIFWAHWKRKKGALVEFSMLEDIPTNSSKCNNNQNHFIVHKETPLSKEHLSQLLYICKLLPRFLFLLLFDYFYWNAYCLLLSNYINYTARAQLLNLFQKKPLVSIKEFYGGSPHVKFHTAGYTDFL